MSNEWFNDSTPLTVKYFAKTFNITCTEAEFKSIYSKYFDNIGNLIALVIKDSIIAECDKILSETIENDDTRKNVLLSYLDIRLKSVLASADAYVNKVFTTMEEISKASLFEHVLAVLNKISTIISLHEEGYDNVKNTIERTQEILIKVNKFEYNNTINKTVVELIDTAICFAINTVCLMQTSLYSINNPTA